ncbi:MAG: hypothetical protein WC855_12350 [Thermodesulfovibrionales bacterium]
MSIIKNIISARRYRQKESVTPEEFLEAMKRDFGRALDPESQLFFRHHSIAVNIVNKILAGRLIKSGDEKKDELVIRAIISEMTEYTPNAISLNPNSRNLIAALVEEFSKTYKDAGNIIGQALVAFLRLK